MGLEVSGGGSEVELASGVFFLDFHFLFFQLNKFELVGVIILIHLDLLFLDLDLSGSGGNLNLFFKDFGFLLMQLL